MQLYKQICDNNRIKYGTEAEKVLKIIINQYSDRTHFIYEILQNAEDAGASYIQFHLKNDQLLIIHNGRLFDEKDVNGVCGIADGTKEDGTRIGHFGIGFKSVYCYTDHPEICSGQYHFVIQDQLFPCETGVRRSFKNEETGIILPFDKTDVPADIAYQEIRDALIKQITAESILMLNNIADVKIMIDGHPDIVNINKAKFSLNKGSSAGKVFSLSLRTTFIRKATKEERELDSDYLFFTDSGKEASSVVFKVEGKELKPVRNSRIYAFFPTAKEAHQNFYIHAPFDTTPARDNFKEGAEYGKHNIKLVESVGKLLRFAFCWMRDNNYLSAAGLNAVFPIYEYENDDILYTLYQNSIDIIKEEKLLPANTLGEFRGIKEIAVPRYAVIVDIFSDSDLKYLRRNSALHWIAKEFSTDAYRAFREFLLGRNFNLQVFDWKDLVAKLDSEFLKQKEISWIAELMARIESYCIKRPYNDGHFINAAKIPFVRTAQGDHICARDSLGKLQVYLNNEGNAQYKIDSAFIKNESIRRFCQQALQIPEYNVEQEVLEKILPKYENASVKFTSDNPSLENIEDLKTIKNAVYSYPHIIDLLKDKYIVTDGERWFRPSDLYIRSDDKESGYSLVRGILQLNFLSDIYSKDSVSVTLDDQFFKTIGCQYGIKKLQESNEKYFKMACRYQGEQAEHELRSVICKKYVSKYDWPFNYEGFPQVFKNITKEKSFAIARFLNTHVTEFSIKGRLIGADDQNYSGRDVASMTVYSMLGMQLCFEKWIYIKNDPLPHNPLEIDRDDILPEYEKYARYLIRELPFKEVKNALSEWIDETYKGIEKEKVKNLLSTPDQLLKIAEAQARSEAKAEAKKNRSQALKEMIEQENRTQKETRPENDLEISPVSEQGKKKREENLDKEFAASLDQFTAVAKGLTFVSRPCNTEERAFLEQEYDGHCQICLKQIKKYNGEHYFEAINIIKPSRLPEKMKNASKFGWNSLCLCPNCAAEYNYSSKKISKLYEQVMEFDAEPDSETTIDIDIEMPESQKRKIHYSPRHFIAIKEAFKIFDDENKGK